MDLKRYAQEVCDLWLPKIESIHHKYARESKLFPGLVAFCGLQLSLWPLWMEVCNSVGFPLNELSVFDYDDPGLHGLPWFVLSQPVNHKLMWVLVRGSNLSDSKDIINSLQSRHMIQTLRTMDEQGITIPGETAVISIDNIEIAGYTNPQLTTMNVQKRAMGLRAAEMIINRSAGRGENAITLMLPVNLVIRKST